MRSSLRRKECTQLILWECVIKAYALTMATVWGRDEGWGTKNWDAGSGKREEEGARFEADLIREWFDELLGEWLETGGGKYFQTGNRQILMERIAWIDSDAGRGMVQAMAEDALACKTK